MLLTLNCHYLMMSTHLDFAGNLLPRPEVDGDEAGFWEDHLSNTMSHRMSLPTEVPSWQITQLDLPHGHDAFVSYPTDVFLPQQDDGCTSTPSAFDSSGSTRFVSPSWPSTHECSEVLPQTSFQHHTIEDAMEMENDPITGSSKSSCGQPKSARFQLKRSSSPPDILVKRPKATHNMVEKQYRERLNEKINNLAQHLFEWSSESSSRPSKLQILERAKERLEHLEAHNHCLESKVNKLSQDNVILSYLAGLGEASSPGCGSKAF
ncbi:hypothetical protein VTL71DRAFT_13271 [Oculimacula yallundae]|uniref:BHLH domain-containing protein n=1 Tax=Oculimacula yallundae TaxID=86028 RepID=A0ABR4CK06_9HELO